MNKNPGKTSAFFAGLYTWIVTIYFGLVVLDILYSRLVPEATTAFAKVSDLFLYVVFLTMLAALGAIAFCWEAKTARYVYIASLFVLLFEFFIPVFLPLFISNATDLSWVRPFPSGAASILAFLGFYKYLR